MYPEGKYTVQDIDKEDTNRHRNTSRDPVRSHIRRLLLSVPKFTPSFRVRPAVLVLSTTYSSGPDSLTFLLRQGDVVSSGGQLLDPSVFVELLNLLIYSTSVPSES